MTELCLADDFMNGHNWVVGCLKVLIGVFEERNCIKHLFHQTLKWDDVSSTSGGMAQRTIQRLPQEQPGPKRNSNYCRLKFIACTSNSSPITQKSTPSVSVIPCYIHSSSTSIYPSRESPSRSFTASPFIVLKIYVKWTFFASIALTS